MVLLSLVTFNAATDVLSAHQRGRGHERESEGEERREALKYQRTSDSLQNQAHLCGLAWFLLAAPEVQNTARNTDGFWVIHGGASRDTNKLLQDVAPLLPSDVRRACAVVLV